jgi:leucyl aminopeptidase (aminopeptidase T)
MFWKKGRETLDSNKTREISGRVLASFGLVCFRKALKSKNMVFDENKEESIERLDPFV